MLARKLLDEGKFQTAYDVIQPAALPANEYYRADHHFMCGWIALRYLDDPATAARHFARIDEGQTNPTVLARANYWRGRAAEALGQTTMRCAPAMKRPRAIRPPITASSRAPRLGRDQIELRPPSPVLASADASATDERVRAADMLYEIGERDVVLYFATDLGEQSSDVACSKRSANSPAAATMPARCCRSESPRSAAGWRSTITPSRPSEFRRTGRSRPKSSTA